MTHGRGAPVADGEPGPGALSVRTPGGTAAPGPRGPGRTPSGTPHPGRPSPRAAAAGEAPASAHRHGAAAVAPHVRAGYAYAPWAVRNAGDAAWPVPWAAPARSPPQRALGWQPSWATSAAARACAVRRPHPPAVPAWTSRWASAAVRAGPERRYGRPERYRARARIHRPGGRRSRWRQGGRRSPRRDEEGEDARLHGVGGSWAVQTTRRDSTRTKDRCEPSWDSRADEQRSNMVGRQ
ncbi:hypothetical protein SAMN06272775_0349 [Streptomyces sp. 2323.1]|nr:hypothetical protein SAMN06272775_0349 [Streptomyces sp. 2323.1]